MLVQRLLRYARLLITRCQQSCYAAFCDQRRQYGQATKSAQNLAPPWLALLRQDSHTARDLISSVRFGLHTRLGCDIRPPARHNPLPFNFYAEPIAMTKSTSTLKSDRQLEDLACSRSNPLL